MFDALHCDAFHFDVLYFDALHFDALRFDALQFDVLPFAEAECGCNDPFMIKKSNHFNCVINDRNL